MGFDFLDFGFPKSGTDWKSINGKPFITVSAKGRSNGLSTKINDGADFGPDTMLNATSPSQTGPPYTQTTGINEAISYAGSQGLEKIVFGEGTFYTNYYISNPYSNMVFIGQGIHKTIITNYSPGSYFPTLIGGDTTNIQVEGMDIIANASGATSADIGLNLSGNGNKHIIYKSCYFSSPGAQVGFVTAGALTGTTPYNGGANLDMPYDISFVDCIFDGKNPYATSPNFGSVMGVDIKFINCLFTSTESLTTTNPIVSYGLSRPNYDGPHYFIGCTFDTPQIYLKIEQGYAATVLGCTFLNGTTINSYENIDYSTYEAPDIGIKIIGNEFSVSSSNGGNIALTNAKGEQSVIITGNHFINTSTSVSQQNPQCNPVGIILYYAGPITGIEITNNTFDNMGQAIWLDGNATTVGQISHNIFNQSLSTTGTTSSAIYFYSGGTGNYIIKDNYNNGYSSFFNGGGSSITFRHINENNYGTGLPYVPSTPTVPASGTAQQNTNQYAVNVYLYGGTVTEIQITKNGTAYTVFSNASGLALSGQVYKLNPNDSITITYTTAPTWEWLSD